MKEAASRNQKRDEAREERFRAIMRHAALREIEAVRFTHIGLFSISLALIAFIVWASQATLDEAAVATGRIVPRGQMVTVQHLEGGIIRSISVTEGTVAEKGEVLIEFNGETMRSELVRMRHRKIALELRAERLRALLQDRQPTFRTVPASLQRARDEEQLAFEAQRRAWDQQLTLLYQTRQVLHQELDAAREMLPIRAELLGLSREELGMFESLMARGNTSDLKLLSARRKHADERMQLSQLYGQIGNLDERLKELDQQINGIDTDTRRQLTSELSILNAELNDVEQSLVDWQDRVHRLTVRAPVTGVIQHLAVKTVGAVVSPGGVVAEIVPSDEPLMAEARLSPRDVGFVKIGQTVEVKVHSFDFARYGSIDGHVDHISASTFMDEQNQPYYRAMVHLEKNYVGTNPARNHLRAGMTLQADITTGKKTLLEYMLKPVFVNLTEGLRER